MAIKKQYKTIKKLSPTGQKTVSIAEDESGHKVVIKEGVSNSPTSIERIKREVGILSDISSDYYPQQISFNFDSSSNTFQIVEEYIEGQNLGECMTMFNTPKKIFRLLKELSDGLKLIWDKRITHRDLKPANIMIRPDGSPCIIDLGIAKNPNMTDLTRTMNIMGPCTPVYASPEQLSNKKDKIDHRTDFFTLGIICLELYLGAHPFDPHLNKSGFNIVENIAQVIYATQTDLINENECISEFANKTLQIEPYSRFRNYSTLSTFLKSKI
jgi:serine/threonine protein kinase